MTVTSNPMSQLLHPIFQLLVYFVTIWQSGDWLAVDCIQPPLKLGPETVRVSDQLREWELLTPSQHQLKTNQVRKINSLTPAFSYSFHESFNIMKQSQKQNILKFCNVFSSLQSHPKFLMKLYPLNFQLGFKIYLFFYSF